MKSLILTLLLTFSPANASSFDAVAFDLISKWEGMENHAYYDRIAKPPLWTVCYGHTKTARSGMYKTDAECRVLLIAEISEYRHGLHTYFNPRTLDRRLTPKRDAAYTSLAYNVGVRGAGRSTATKRLNAGDIAGGCKALTWWNRAGGRVVRGLVRRRSDEYEFCVEGL